MRPPRSVLAALVALAALLLVGCQQPSTPSATPEAAATKVTVGLTYIPNIQFSPWYVATDKGLIDPSVAVTLRHHGQSEGLFNALVAGQENFIIAGGDELMQARAAGMDLVAIASYYRTYPVELIVKDSSAIKSLADLKGKKIGLPGKYGESWFGLKVALANANLSESDVQIVEIGYTQQAALATDKVDAVVGYANNEAVQFALAGIPVRGIGIDPAGAPPLVSISLISTRAYLDSHPDVAKKVVSGLKAGIEAVAKNPDEAITISARQVPTLNTDAAKAAAKATLTATIKLMTKPDGAVDLKLDAAQWAAMATFMKAKGLVATQVDPTKAMSTAYVS